MKKLIIMLGIILSANYVCAQNWVSLQGGLNSNGSILYPDSINGELFVCGQYWTVNGYSNDGVVAWNGSQWDTLYNMCCFSFCGPKPVGSIIRYQNELYAGGAFV